MMNCLQFVGRCLIVCLLIVPSAYAEPPTSLVGIFSGASQMNAWYTGSSDPIDNGFSGSQNAKRGSAVWTEELKRSLPDLSISTWHVTQAGTGFVNNWWTEAGGLTAGGRSVRDQLLAQMRTNPDAPGFVAHMLASATFADAYTPQRTRTEMVGYASALKAAVDAEFGAGNRKFDFWWVDAGNRWNNVDGGQNTAAARRRQAYDVAGVRDYVPGADPLPYFHVSSGVMSYVIGDWNSSSDGTHYTRADNQRVGRQLAYSMALDLGVQPTDAGGNTIRRELSVESAWRDPDDPNALFVKVLTNGGKLIADKATTRVSLASGVGVDVGSSGLSQGDKWENLLVDNSTAASGYSLVRLRRTTPLPTEDLLFSHTWGTYHWITSGGPTGPLSVWHEDLAWGNGMTQDFADLNALPRPMIMTLGAEHLIPVLDSPPIPEPTAVGLMGTIILIFARRPARLRQTAKSE